MDATAVGASWIDLAQQVWAGLGPALGVVAGIFLQWRMQKGQHEHERSLRHEEWRRDDRRADAKMFAETYVAFGVAVQRAAYHWAQSKPAPQEELQRFLETGQLVMLIGPSRAQDAVGVLTSLTSMQAGQGIPVQFAKALGDFLIAARNHLDSLREVDAK